ncbi:hypothetical protein [Robiginitalea sp.]|uniref:hypothetical protein n=1 Tax=Robiginitalea sp. TaxID=1902411 RepID=UPI003C419124
MKRKLNIWLGISFLIALTLTIWLNTQLEKQVGDIAYITSADPGNSEPCNQDFIYQYYQINTDYIGGKRAIKRELSGVFPMSGLNKSGLLTVRFVVNCQGKTGWYHSKMISPDLEEMDISDTDFTHLYGAISELNHWLPGLAGEEPQDSYFQISFKLKKGEVLDIF